MFSDRTIKDSEQDQENNISLTSIQASLQQVLYKVYEQAEFIISKSAQQELGKIVDEVGAIKEGVFASMESAFMLLLNQVQMQKKLGQTEINQSDYQILEEALQKSESEVRSHIRMQQQLKLYVDSAQEKIQSLQQQLKIEEKKYHQIYQSVKILDGQRKQLKREIKRLQERLKSSINFDREKVRTHKSNKVLPESHHQNHHNHHGSGAFYDSSTIMTHKSKPNIQQYSHSSSNKSKDRINQKSFDRDKRESAMTQPPRKNSKLKIMEGRINIGLPKSNEPHPDKYDNKPDKTDKSYEESSYIPTQQDIKIFKEMTKTVQMKEACKRPVRRNTKYKTQGKELIKNNSRQMKVSGQCREYRSVSMYQ